MKRTVFIVAGLAVALTGCGSSESEVTERVTTVDAAEADSWSGSGPAPVPPPPPPAPDMAISERAQEGSQDIRVAPADIPAAQPKIAYAYHYGFRVPAANIAPVQQRHADLCEEAGPQVCRIISLSNSGAEGDYASGNLQLAIRADRARGFGSQLAEVVTSQEGEQTSASITGEDLSKQLVDTEARLRARTLLRDRLMEVLESRRGTVAELVEAERGVAQVNEEIDQARSWLEEMRTRVAFSRMEISYTSGQPTGGGFVEPIRSAFGGLGNVLGIMIAGLLYIIVIAGPIALLVWLGIRLSRRTREQDDAALARIEAERAANEEAVEAP